MTDQIALRKAQKKFLHSGATFPLAVSGPVLGLTLRRPDVMRFDYRAETLADEQALRETAEAKGIDGDTAVSIAKIESVAKL